MYNIFLHVCRFSFPIPCICIRYCRRIKIQKNHTLRWFDQRRTFYVVFLLYRLVCKSRFNAFTLFFNPAPYTPDHLCFFIRKLNNFFIPLTFHLLVVRTVSLSIYLFFYLFFYLSHSSFSLLSRFYTLLIFSLSLMLGAAILVTRAPQRVDGF